MSQTSDSCAAELNEEPEPNPCDVQVHPFILVDGLVDTTENAPSYNGYRHGKNYETENAGEYELLF